MSGSPPPPRPSGARARLIVAAVLFVGWMSWLGYTALTKSRAPVVSHAQAAGATVAVVAELSAGADGRQVVLFRRNPRSPEVIDLKEKADGPAIVVKVVEPLKGAPKAGASIAVANLPDCAGYAGPGTYLLLLNADADAVVEGLPAYTLARPPRSPGADLAGPPRIYPWSDATAADLRKQVKALLP